MGFFSKKKTVTSEIVETPKKEKTNQGNNPYLNARAEWLERYGSYIARARNWRMVAFICLCITILSVTGNVIQATQVKTIPYIIEVDKLGKSAVAARADKINARPMRLIQAEIAACIRDWRTVTADVELQKQMITRLSFFFAGAAKGVLKEWYSANNPYEVAKEGRLVHVEIKSLPLQISKDTYRIEWIETIRTHAGAMVNSMMYEASVTIQINPPTSEAILLHNPGGVYITDLSASRIYHAPAPAAPDNNQNGE